MAETNYQDAPSGLENPLKNETKTEENDPYPSHLKDHKIKEIKERFETSGLNTEQMIPDAMDTRQDEEKKEGI